MLAAAALCGLALAGCTPRVGACGQAVTPAPVISVEMRDWIDAHPDTNVRVCVDRNCLIGYSTIQVQGRDPATPLHPGDAVAVVIEPVQGETAVGRFTGTARLVDGPCGQWGAHLRFVADGRITSVTR